MSTGPYALAGRRASWACGRVWAPTSRVTPSSTRPSWPATTRCVGAKGSRGSGRPSYHSVGLAITMVVMGGAVPRERGGLDFGRMQLSGALGMCPCQYVWDGCQADIADKATSLWGLGQRKDVGSRGLRDETGQPVAGRRLYGGCSRRPLAPAPCRDAQGRTFTNALLVCLFALCATRSSSRYWALA